MRVILLVILLTAASTTAPLAQTCHTDKVSTSPGQLLFTLHGWKFKIFPGGSRITSSWLPLDRLKICRKGGTAYEITDLSQRNEKVEGLYYN